MQLWLSVHPVVWVQLCCLRAAVSLLSLLSKLLSSGGEAVGAHRACTCGPMELSVCPTLCVHSFIGTQAEALGGQLG